MKTDNYDRVFGYSFASIHKLYVTKVERKGQSRETVDQVICWLTGHDAEGLEATIHDGRDLKAFFESAPVLNPNRELITGVICGVRVEEIEDRTMQLIRYMDKLVDEVAKGRKMEKILRG
jgi:hypothetical protein